MLKNSKMLNQLLEIVDKGHTATFSVEGLFLNVQIGKLQRQLPREKMYDSKIQENISEMLEELDKTD